MSGKPDRATYQARMEDMLSTLRTEIISGIRPQGSYLPSEIELGELFQLSKKSVRKALEILVDEGLVCKIPRVGNRVLLPDSSPVTTLRLGIYASIEEQAFLPELLERFLTAYPNIRVETVMLPYTKYPYAIKGYLENGFLDVFTLNNRNFQEIEEANHLHLLEPQSPNPAHHTFLIRQFSHNGALYSTPLMFSPVVLCYNKGVFKNCGLSMPNSGWTWDVLLETAIAIRKKAGINGFYAHIESLNRFPIFLLQSGFRFEARPSGYRYDDPKLWDVLHRCRSLFLEQGFLPAFLSERDAGAERLFMQQKVGMIMTTYYGLNMMKQVPFEYDITPLPYAVIPKTLLLTTGLSINRFSKQKEIARLFVDFLASEPSQRYIQKQTLSLPANGAAADQNEEDGLAGPPRYPLYREIMPTFADYRELNITIEALDDFSQELKLFWGGLDEPESIIQRVQTRLMEM